MHVRRRSSLRALAKQSNLQPSRYRTVVLVIIGLVPVIHVLLHMKTKTWMAGHRRAEATPFFERLGPAMTTQYSHIPLVP